MAQAVGDRERQLQYQANTDLLTGLAQRTHFIALGEPLLQPWLQTQGSPWLQTPGSALRLC